MFRKNRWKALYKIVKDYDGSIEASTTNIPVVVLGCYIRTETITSLSITFAEGKTLIASMNNISVLGFASSETATYHLDCRWSNGTGTLHRLDNYVNARKIFKIISKKILKDIDLVQEDSGQKAAKEAFKFVFGDKE